MELASDDDDGDKIDATVEASDNMIVDEIVQEVKDEHGWDSWEGKLTHEDVNLGCFSLSKVSPVAMFNFLCLTLGCDSL